MEVWRQCGPVEMLPECVSAHARAKTDGQEKLHVRVSLACQLRAMMDFDVIFEISLEIVNNQYGRENFDQRPITPLITRHIRMHRVMADNQLRFTCPVDSDEPRQREEWPKFWGRRDDAGTYGNPTKQAENGRHQVPPWLALPAWAVARWPVAREMRHEFRIVGENAS